MLIYVEGNIGCGKSTLLDNLSRECAHDKTIRVVQEGLDEWMQVSDGKGNILDHFYQDKEKYSFALQMVILTQRHFQIKKIVREMQAQSKDFILIVERSAASCDRVFRKILPISDLEHAAFDFIYNKLQTDEAEMGVPIRYLYLDLPAEQCLSRIKSRARVEERSIELDYL